MVDGGVTWQEWNAENIFPDGECCNSPMNSNCAISKNGKSEMILVAMDEKIAKIFLPKILGNIGLVKCHNWRRSRRT